MGINQRRKWLKQMFYNSGVTSIPASIRSYEFDGLAYESLVGRFQKIVIIKMQPYIKTECQSSKHTI